VQTYRRQCHRRGRSRQSAEWPSQHGSAGGPSTTLLASSGRAGWPSSVEFFHSFEAKQKGKFALVEIELPAVARVVDADDVYADDSFRRYV
jgi:hypothetical protein